MDWNKKTKIIYSPRRIAGSRKKRSISAPIIIVCLIGACAYGVYWFFNYKKFQIESVHIEGTAAIAAGDIERVIREYEGERVWNIFPKSNYFLFSSDEVSGHITRAFLRIAEARVEKTFPDRTDIVIRERIPWGIACRGSTQFHIASSTVESECAYIDQSGFAYEHSPVLFGALTKKIFIGDPVTLGDTAIPEERLRMYDEFRDRFSSFSLPVTAMVVTKETPRDIQMYLGNWYVLVDRDSGAEDVARVLRPLLERELSGKMSRIDYIDLRFGNKVFYKLKK